MEIFLALIFGLAVAGVVFVLGRIVVGSSGKVAEEAVPRSESSHFAVATSNGASAIVEKVDVIEALHQAAPASEQMENQPRKRTRKHSTDLSGHAVDKPRSQRSRKPPKTTLPGTDVVQ
jgi:hypothetical protein